VHDAAGCGEANARLIAAAPELLENPEPVRDRIMEARENGNPSPFSV
jgi:hypothetical protein